MRFSRSVLAGVGVALCVGAAVAVAGGGDPEIGYGGPEPGLRDSQNEPAIAVDEGAVARGVPASAQPLVAGANTYYDELPCGGSTTCSFYPGVGISGVYFSFDGGVSWTTEPDLHYAGFTPPSAPRPARIVTVPRFAKRFASHGDPVLAFGPRPDGGVFSWENGSRLYYAMLAQRFLLPDKAPQWIMVSRTDDLGSARMSVTTSWLPPVAVSRPQLGDYYADKPAIWADNAASSKYFGSVYLCWASYKSYAEAAKGGSPRPILFSRSTDGGTAWSRPMPLASGATGGPTRQGCALRTDSNGGIYVVWEGGSPASKTNAIYLTRSYDGGTTFDPARRIADVTEAGQVDSTQNRRTIDGIGGARTNSFPSLDIANGAPNGATQEQRPPDTIVVAWDDGHAGPNQEEVLLTYSTDHGASWSTPAINVTAPPPTGFTIERPDLPAVAISPDGRILYVVYTAFHTAWQKDPSKPRSMGGVMRAARFAVVARRLDAEWKEIRGAPGDPRGTANAAGEERAAAAGVATEFIGDYNSVVATSSAGYGAWIDLAAVQSCDKVDQYRISIARRKPVKPPNFARECAKEFGNANLFGGVIYASEVP